MQNNPVESKQKILFICSRNKKRSPTAEDLYSEFPNLETRSAGLEKNAEYVLSSDDLEWADLVFVMEKNHLKNLEKKFAQFIQNKRVICLNIPDRFGYGDEELIQILRKKADPFLLI